MTKLKTNRVIGARGIGVYNSNLNNAFNGNPKMLPNGTFFNSDVSTKYADRLFWKNSGCNVLIQKHLKMNSKGEIYAATLDEVVKDKVKNKNKNLEIMNNFVDVQNFGAAITIKGINLGITGVVQYGQGINKLNDSEVIVQDIISPFGTGNNASNVKKVEKGEEVNMGISTNIGKHTFIDKALYVQGFTVNPNNLNNYKEIFEEGFEGYKEESYNMFKKAVLSSITLQNTRTKEGCQDEFSIFINLKENSIYALNNLTNYINVTVEDNINIIDLSKLEFLNEVDDIESIEIYYNNVTCKINHSFNNAIVKNLLTSL